MKFSCNTSEFLQALHLVSRAISGQQALPILGNILLAAEGKRCTVSATDLELSIVTHFEANIENEGSITIPAKAILNFIKDSLISVHNSDSSKWCFDFDLHLISFLTTKQDNLLHAIHSIFQFLIDKLFITSWIVTQMYGLFVRVRK